MQNLVALLNNKGIRPSLQRLQIYAYLHKNKIHPTVDIIYTALAQEIPTLSKTTVYNTLKLFLQHNLIQTLSIEDDELRYDAELEFHAHFKCTKCGIIYDILLENPIIQPNLPEGFLKQKTEFCMWGECALCKK